MINRAVVKMDDKRPCIAQFLINHFSKDEREFLMKKEIREEVCKLADVDIAIRGRYYPPKEADSVDSSRRLHLSITGRSKQNLNTAIQKLESLIKQNGSSSGSVQEDTNLEEKITVGIDVFPSVFHMSGKILGENNENVDYLTKETGAVISLRGKGSGCVEGKDEELHVLVKYKDIASKPKTQELILNLIETVQQDFIDNYGKYYPRPKKSEIFPVKIPEIKPKKVTPPPPPKEPVKSTKKVSDDAGSHIEKITLGLKHVPLKFNLKSKIYGPNLSNVKHIEKVSSAVLLVEGVSSSADGNKVNPSETPHILVKYLKPELKDMARSLILNLIETIHQDFESLYGAYLEKPESPEILPVKTASNFSKPSPKENSVRKPVEKSPPPPVKKQTKENLRPDPRKFPEKSPSGGPVPPPPPVISKALSPDFITFSTNHSVNKEPNTKSFREQECNKSFSDKRPAVTAYSQVEPIRSYAEVNQLKVPYRLENIKPIPSIVPPVAGLPSQSLLSTPPYPPPVSNYEELQEIQPLSNIQPLMSSTQEYYKKRSMSPVDMGHDPKKFCTIQLLGESQPFGHIESIDNCNIPREVAPKPSPLAKMRSANNRCLVELPKVSSTPVPQKGKSSPTAKAAAAKRATMWDTPMAAAAAAAAAATTHADGWNPSSPPKEANRVPGTQQPGEPKTVRWSGTTTVIEEEAVLPPKIPPVANDNAPWGAKSAASGTPWGAKSFAAATATEPTGPKKAVSLKLRGPVKHQQNGKPVADGEAVMSFLNECAKATEARNKYDMFDESPDEETKSIILIDSDEEVQEVRPDVTQQRTRTVAVQTDECLRKVNIRCACGRFTKALNTVRSMGAQTMPVRQGQKL